MVYIDVRSQYRHKTIHLFNYYIYIDF